MIENDLIEHLRKIVNATEKYIVELRKSKIEVLQDNLRRTKNHGKMLIKQSCLLRSA